MIMCSIIHCAARKLICSGRGHAQNIIEFSTFSLKSLKISYLHLKGLANKGKYHKSSEQPQKAQWKISQSR